MVKGVVMLRVCGGVKGCGGEGCGDVEGVW